MNFYFLDSSALVKRYLPEIGTGWIRSLLQSKSNNRILISQITPIEITSSLARRQREGMFGKDILALIQQKLEIHHQQYITVELRPDLGSLAKKLLVNYPLRAMDAIQLASAIAVYQQLQNAPITTSSISFTFICSDKRLLEIAQQEGLAVDNPLDHI